MNSVLWAVHTQPIIQLPEGIPGILGPMAFSPETAKHLNALAELLLRGPNTLSAADREMIATYVSSQNDCYFCQHAHGAVAAYRLNGDEKLVNHVKMNFESAEISEKSRHCLQSPARCNVAESKSQQMILLAPVSREQRTKRFTTPC